MTTTEQIEALKKSLTLMTRISGNIQTDDYEDLDAMNRTIHDMGEQLFELELSLQSTAENLAVAA